MKNRDPRPWEKAETRTTPGSSPVATFELSLGKKLLALEMHESLAQVLSELQLARPEGLGPLELQRGVEALLAAGNSPEALKASAVVFCRYAEELKDDRVCQILAMLLRSVRPREMAAWVLSDALAPVLGPANLARALALLGESDAESLVKLLTSAYPHATGTLRDVLEDRWLGIARTARGVRLWAETHPQTFLKAGLHTRLLNVCRRETVLGGLELILKEKPEVAAALLRKFPVESPLHADVIYLTLEKGDASLRVVALHELRKQPTPRTIAILHEVLKKNNARETPDAAEVEAALLALREIKTPAAAAILEEVSGARNTLFFPFRRQIRRILQDLERGSLVP